MKMYKKTLFLICLVPLLGLLMIGCGAGVLGGGKTCTYGDTVRQHGETFSSEDGCNTCSCDNGSVMCTLRACPNPGKSCGMLSSHVCSASEVCIYPIGTCDKQNVTTGTCSAKNVDCVEIYQPVCGCDGKTYGNACSAHSQGISIARNGKCEAPVLCRHAGKEYKVGETFKDDCNDCTCREDGQVVCTRRACEKVCGGFGGFKCGEGEFCLFGTHCGEADGSGVCKAKPTSCNLNYAPVCGCDGKTYGNECAAHSSGVSVRAQGKCEAQKRSCVYNGKTYKHGDSFEASDGCNKCTCLDGGVSCTKVGCARSCGGMDPNPNPCQRGFFCDYGARCGAKGVEGVCKPKPQGCTEEYAPVCGCDGKTHGNACSAHSVGVSIVHIGECKKPMVCSYNGKTYKIGDIFKSTDGCNDCLCQTGGSVACTQKACGTKCGAGGYLCKKGEYCKYAMGVCGSKAGVCKPLGPKACPDRDGPVCGCDGKMYNNECHAESLGVSIAHAGACAVPPTPFP